MINFSTLLILALFTFANAARLDLEHSTYGSPQKGKPLSDGTLTNNKAQVVPQTGSDGLRPRIAQKEPPLSFSSSCADVSTPKNVELAVVLSSSFCSNYDSTASAVEAATSLLSEAETVFAKSNCLRFKVIRFDAYCGARSEEDPYDADGMYISTDASRIILSFASYWNEKFSSVERDLTLLLTDFADESSGVIHTGSGYIAGACDNRFNYVWVNGDLASTLVHELGHAFGASNSESGVMKNPIPADVSVGFSEKSTSEIIDFVDNGGLFSSCIGEDTVKPSPAFSLAPTMSSAPPSSSNVPSVSPSASAFVTPSRSSHPTPKTEESPSISPTSSLLASPSMSPEMSPPASVSPSVVSSTRPTASPTSSASMVPTSSPSGPPTDRYPPFDESCGTDLAAKRSLRCEDKFKRIASPATEYGTMLVQLRQQFGRFDVNISAPPPINVGKDSEQRFLVESASLYPSTKKKKEVFSLLPEPMINTAEDGASSYFTGWPVEFIPRPYKKPECCGKELYIFANLTISKLEMEDGRFVKTGSVELKRVFDWTIRCEDLMCKPSEKVMPMSPDRECPICA